MHDETHMPHGQLWKAQDITDWWLSEKLDGCRALWDGEQMWTRAGRAVALPAHFRAALPTCVLDGELWAGRGKFQLARAAACHGRFARSVRFMVFDAPGGGDYPARLDAARGSVDGRVAQVVALTRAEHTAHAFRMMQAVQRKGGEGIIARAPHSRWFTGRRPEILKLKDDEQLQLARLLRLTSHPSDDRNRTRPQR